MTPPLPDHLRAVAEHERVVAPDYEWIKFLSRNGDKVPEKNLEERWGRWIRTAKKHEPEPDPNAPRGSDAPTPFAVWKEPESWKEARELDPDHSKINLPAAQKILDMLNAMGGAPVVASKPVAPSVVDPLCSCGRIMTRDQKTCGMCKPKEANDGEEESAAE